MKTKFQRATGNKGIWSTVLTIALLGGSSAVASERAAPAVPERVIAAKRLRVQQLTEKTVKLDGAPVERSVNRDVRLRQSALSADYRVALNGARFREAFGSNLNSAVVNGVVITPEQTRPARRRHAQRLAFKDVRLDNSRVDSPKAKETRSRTRYLAAEQTRFRETFGQNLNSPVLDGASVSAQPDQTRRARRHRAPQVERKDVVLDAGRVAKTSRTDRRASRVSLEVAVREVRFRETFGVSVDLPVVDGVAIEPARRLHTPQIAEKDVALDSVRPEPQQVKLAGPVHGLIDSASFRSALRQSSFGKVAAKPQANEQLRHSQRHLDAYYSLSLRTALRDAGFREVRVAGGTCLPWGCGENSPVIDGAVVAPVRRRQAPQITRNDVMVEVTPSHAEQPPSNFAAKLQRGQLATGAQRYLDASYSGSFRTALRNVGFGEGRAAGGACLPWGCGENSPVVGGAAVAPVRRRQARQIVSKDVPPVVTRTHAVEQASAKNTANAHKRGQGRSEQRYLDASYSGSFRTAPRHAQFGEAGVRGGNCLPWGCGENSPVLDGVAVKPVRRRQAPQIKPNDVAVTRSAPGEPTSANTAADVNRGKQATGARRHVDGSYSASFRTALWNVSFAEARVAGGSCLPWGCGENSPVLDGVAVKPVRRRQAPQIKPQDVTVTRSAPTEPTSANIAADVNRGKQATGARRHVDGSYSASFGTALRNVGFAEATVAGGACLPWGCGANSPAITAAALTRQPCRNSNARVTDDSVIGNQIAGSSPARLRNNR